MAIGDVSELPKSKQIFFRIDRQGGRQICLGGWGGHFGMIKNAPSTRSNSPSWAPWWLPRLLAAVCPNSLQICEEEAVPNQWHAFQLRYHRAQLPWGIECTLNWFWGWLLSYWRAWKGSCRRAAGQWVSITIQEWLMGYCSSVQAPRGLGENGVVAIFQTWKPSAAP